MVGERGRVYVEAGPHGQPGEDVAYEVRGRRRAARVDHDVAAAAQPICQYRGEG